MTSVFVQEEIEKAHIDPQQMHCDKISKIINSSYYSTKWADRNRSGLQSFERYLYMYIWWSSYSVNYEIITVGCQKQKLARYEQIALDLSNVWECFCYAWPIVTLHTELSIGWRCKKIKRMVVTCDWNPFLFLICVAHVQYTWKRGLIVWLSPPCWLFWHTPIDTSLCVRTFT